MHKQHFDLQPDKSKLNELAEEYWTELSAAYREYERAAFEAGLSIRNGALTRENLEKIVYWKSPRVKPHIAKNDELAVRNALAIAASPDTPAETAFEKLMELKGVGLPVASAILTAIYPERYTIIDYRALEALGYLRQSVGFYMEYLDVCKRIAEQMEVAIQDNYPAPTPLRALDRALWQWSTKNEPER